MISSKKKPLLLVIIIALLLVSDLVFLYLVVQKKPAPHPPQRFTTYMTDLLRTKVGFTEEQIYRYEQRRTEHKKNMGPLYDQIKETKENFYQLLLQTDVPDSVFYHYLGMIGEQQEEFDRKIFYHLLSLRELCTQDQLPLLTAAIPDLLKYKHLE